MNLLYGRLGGNGKEAISFLISFTSISETIILSKDEEHVVSGCATARATTRLSKIISRENGKTGVMWRTYFYRLSASA